jgi:glycosyltransferase involved in cell wall biosynthesis
MRVLMLVQQIEESHWLRGFIVRWVRELAAQVEQVQVITLELGQADLPANVTIQTMGKERGYGRLREVIAFYRALARVIRDVDVIFSHMTPRYTWLAAPLALIFRKPQVLWYTHPQIHWELRLATALSRRVVTASETSFPLQTPKLCVLGHGIDTDFFSPTTGRGDLLGRPNTQPYILLVGRLTRIKNRTLLLRALPQIEAQVVFIGGTASEADTAYVEELKSLAADLGVADRVTFTGALPTQEVRDWNRQAAIAVNLTPSGSFDKTVLESMATCTPTVVAHHGFDDLLGESASRFRIESPDDLEGLIAQLKDLLNLSAEERLTLMTPIRQRVVAAHSLQQLITRLVQVFAEMSR